MPRKKRRLIWIISVVTAILIGIGTLLYLYFTTDLFYSKQTLFMKYMGGNFSKMQSFIPQENTSLEQLLETNPYTSYLTAEVEYIKELNTSAENKKNTINQVQLQITGKVDKSNEYDYRDIQLIHQNDVLGKVEYIQQDDTYGLRLNGIKQFVSVKDSNLQSLESKMGITNHTLENAIALTERQSLKNIFDFTEQEKQTLQNTYIGILNQMISADSYKKQANAIITVNGKEVSGNAYSVKITKEQYNNILINIFEKLTQDEIILEKADQFGNYINQYNLSSNTEKYYRDVFVKKLKEKITEIQNSNIGQEEVKITVYESDRQTVRTLIETPNEKISLDFYEQGILLDNITYSNNQQIEKKLTFEKKYSETQQFILLKQDELIDEEIKNSKQIQWNRIAKDSQITTNAVITFVNENNKAILTVNDNCILEDDITNKIELSSENNVILNEYDQEKISSIVGILSESWKEQSDKISSVLKQDDVSSMLKEIGMVGTDSIIIEETEEVTEAERSRFNSNFEFFVGEELSSEDIQNMLEVVRQHLKDMTIVSSQELELKIQRGNKNEEIAQKVSDMILANKNKKYTVNMGYNERTKLIDTITIKINEKK